jgi:ribosomal protein S12 methylthiotransferase
MVSLGCPKALVDSERILTRLRSEGYEISPDYAEADAVIVNTCGFLDSAKAESLDAIGEALKENGRVIVTGCMGKDEALIRDKYPNILAVTGAHQYEQVVDAVHTAVPHTPDPFKDLIPAGNVQLTPRHYAYLKISEGCNHSCKFCIIPDLRGKLKSRPAASVLGEAQRLVKAGVKEILVISQDTSAYGVDLKYASTPFKGQDVRAHIFDLSQAFGDLEGERPWIRLHYVYPYPHVDQLIPLMAQGILLPYLDIPFQHAAPSVLKRMARPANEAKVLERLTDWRSICPDIAVRSTFIVGYPGETEEEFQYLLDWLHEAKLDRVGCFKYENVDGAAAKALPDQIPEDVKQDRWNRFMETAQKISAQKLADKVGTRQQVIIDSVDDEGAIARTRADAPEIDGQLFIDEGFETLKPGDIITVTVDEASDYDLWGTPVISKHK